MRFTTTFSCGAAVLFILAVLMNVQDARSEEKPPQPLAGTAWVAEDIDGEGVTDKVVSLLQFSDDGRLSGSGGCNRLIGTPTIEGDKIRFGNLGMTMMACPPDKMEQEQRFNAALQDVTRYSIDDNGFLLLFDDADRVRVRLAPTAAEQTKPEPQLMKPGEPRK